MDKPVIIAYCNTQELPNITEADLKRLDCIHISFGLINQEGEVYWNQKGTEGVLDKIRKIHSDIKIVLSIGGWEADGFSQAAKTEEGRQKFVKSAVKIMQDNQLDGIDIDWEYPCSSQAGIASSPKDKDTFTLLIKEIRQQLDVYGKGYTLSIAAGALQSYIDGTNMDQIQKYLDYVQLMTYDFHGVFTPTTGHHANLYDDGVLEEKISADQAIKMFENAGVPIEKIVMGVAFYGRGWLGVPSNANGLGQIPQKIDNTHYGYEDILKLLENDEKKYQYYWDSYAKAAFLYNGDSFITYEDKKAITQKVDYVKEKKMYGIMFWEYSEDQTRTLVKHIYDELKNQKEIDKYNM